MSVTRSTRWTGGTREDAIVAVNTSKPYIKKLGGSLEAKEIYSVPQAGQWMTLKHFPDLQTYENAERVLAVDAAYQSAVAGSIGRYRIRHDGFA